MTEVDQRRGLGPPFLALVMLLATAGLPAAAAGARPTDALAACGPVALGGPGRATGWFRRVGRTDARGGLRGYTLTAGVIGRPTTLRVGLPSESFVAGPARGLVVYGADDGRRSDVRAVRLADGCDVRLFESDRVVRGASFDPAGVQLYLHTVDRHTRADLGVWRGPLSGGELVQVLPGLPDPEDGPFGRTGTTILAWSPAGRTLAVQSCGMFQCRTRLLDVSTGRVTLDATPGQGEIIGLSDTERIGYAACGGLPCPIVAIAPAGRRRTLVRSADVAALVGAGRDVALWYERPDGRGGTQLRRHDLATGTDRRMARDAGLRLAWPARWADAGIETPAGSALLAPDGTWAASTDAFTATTDGSNHLRLQTLAEVSR